MLAGGSTAYDTLEMKLLVHQGNEVKGFTIRVWRLGTSIGSN